MSDKNEFFLLSDLDPKGIKESMAQARKFRKEYVEECYGDIARVHQLLHDFHFDFDVDLLLNTYSDLLFDGENPFFRHDSVSVQRKFKFNETAFHSVYDIVDETDETLGIPHNTLVVFAEKGDISKNPSFFKRFGFDSVVDFEIFESPSLQNEPYQFPLHDVAKEVSAITGDSTKAIRHAVRKNMFGLYVEMEKIHLRMARKDGVFYPIYVGIGANEPLGLKIPGEMGAQRFIKHNFENGKTGYARGVINKKPFSITDSVRDGFGNIEYLADGTEVLCVMHNGKMTYLIDDSTQLVPEFEYDFISQDDYFDNVFRQSNPLDVLVQSVKDAIVPYQDFAKLAYDPTYLIQTCGVKPALTSRNKITASKKSLPDQTFVENPALLASDFYERDIDDRLKLGSVLLARLHQRGELERILYETADSN
jgi:hypothetical protein